MKRTLKDQLIATVKSGEIIISKAEGEPNNTQLKNSEQTVKDVHSEDRDILFLKQLAMEGQKQTAVSIAFPRGLKDIDAFLDFLYDVLKTGFISDLENFFCLCAFAALEPKACEGSSRFKQQFTLAARYIFIERRPNQKVSDKDLSDFKRIFDSDQSFINHDELDGLPERYRKRKSQEEYRRKQNEIAQRCSEIEQPLSLYDFEGAKKLYHEYRDIIDWPMFQILVRKYETKQADEKLGQIKLFLDKFDFKAANRLYLEFEQNIPRKRYQEMELHYREKYSLKKLKQIILPILDNFDYSNADRLYKEHQDIIWLRHYETAKEEALFKGLENKIVNFLKKGKYQEADELANSNSSLSKDWYLELKTKFLADNIISISKYRFEPEDAHELAMMILHEAAQMVNILSAEKIGRFLLDKLPESVSVPDIYWFTIEIILEGVKKGALETDSQNVFLAVRNCLKSEQLVDIDKTNLWSILHAYPSVLQKFVNSAAPLIEKIADAYPYEWVNDIVKIYLPHEKLCLQYLKDHSLELSSEYQGFLKAVFQKHRYFNCEMVVALFQAVLDKKRIHLNDILQGLLREIVNRAFDYKMQSKSKIENHIFPKCISKSGFDRFQVNDPELIFCEGLRVTRKDGTVYMRCRNHICHERTEYLNESASPEPNCGFFDLMQNSFGFSSFQIFENEDNSLAMGSFNRWNEIADRLVCGYPDGEGCGSTLIFDSINKGRPGWQAYATTYWHCSNETCNKQNSIKLSHCRGCAKIIDSRVDKHTCHRNDPIAFYICIDCGYCCKQHGVSGICPACGQISMRCVDNYDSIYQCEKCKKPIKTPLWLPKDQKNTQRHQKNETKKLNDN